MRTTKNILTLVSIFLTVNSFAQQELTIDNIKDTILPEHSVLLLPYVPNYYLSDADRDIVRDTKKDAARIREEFHHNIEWQVFKAIEKKHNCVSILQKDTMKLYYDAASELFNVTGYSYAKPLYKAPETIVDAIYNKPTIKSAADSRTASTYLNANSGEKFMNATLTKKEVLHKLYEKFATDYFVFLTQLEIRTNYKTCLDIANKIYQREVLLHFAVYDKEGRQIAGNYAVSYFTSDKNNAYDIMEVNFKELAEGVASSF